MYVQNNQPTGGYDYQRSLFAVTKFLTIIYLLDHAFYSNWNKLVKKYLKGRFSFCVWLSCNKDGFYKW